MPYRQNILAGALLIVASELLFATMGAAVKFAAATLEVLTPRFAGGALLIAIAGMLALRSQAPFTTANREAVTNGSGV
jgi:hypothetical protein